MKKSLVIVESPAKAKTINKFLGRNFVVKASMGHVRDLPKKSLGVDEKKDFKPTYEILPGRKKVMDELKKAAETADKIYLAPDPDREGEAISWHLAEVLKKTNKNLHRVMFNEITKRAVQHGMDHPEKIDSNKVDAQQARRILDRLVGYKVSPLLWDKVRRGLSAGRVQSVALRIVVEREREIQAFKPEEYWTLGALLEAKEPPPFEARLFKIGDKKADLKTQAETDATVASLEGAAFVVRSVESKEKKKNPVPPFITSKLQQDASRKLGFTVRKTMTLAQRLYEGMDLGDLGTVGLITYMRTDSTRIAPEAMQEVRDYIVKAHGPEFLPEEPRVFKTAKLTQGAHEAIRPTSMELAPDQVKNHIGKDEFLLYSLIWNRFVASQMKPAVFDVTTADIEAGPCVFRATGSTMRFAGYLAVYQDIVEKSRKDSLDAPEEDDAARALPPLTEGERLKLQKLDPKQHFTQPPPRFTEASLVKEMEENGIGRPSTYATILATLQTRDYVEKVEVRPDGARSDGDRSPGPALRGHPGRQVHRPDGGGARRDRGGPAGLRGRPEGVQQAVQQGPQGGHRQHGKHQEDGGADRPHLREVRQADGDQVGPLRTLHGLLRLPGLQEHAGDHHRRQRQRRQGGDRGGRRRRDPGHSRGPWHLREVRLGDGPAQGALRAVHRLLRLPEVPQHEEDRHGPGREDHGHQEAGSDPRGEVPSVREAPRRQGRPLRRVHRLLQLPRVQVHQAEGGRPRLPARRVRRPDRRTPLAPRPGLLRLQQLPQVRFRDLVPTRGRALSLVRQPLRPREDHQEGRHHPVLRSRGVRLQEGRQLLTRP